MAAARPFGPEPMTTARGFVGLVNFVIVEEMQKKRLGNSDMELTPIGVGAWAMGGGGWAFAWGPQDDAQSIAAIHRALDHGVNWIDTAPVYGLGHSEEVVARALEGRSNRPFVFTKCERPWNEKREIQRVLKRESIRRECEDSLRRLRVDAIDLRSEEHTSELQSPCNLVC